MARMRGWVLLLVSALLACGSGCRLCDRYCERQYDPYRRGPAVQYPAAAPVAYQQPVCVPQAPACAPAYYPQQNCQPCVPAASSGNWSTPGVCRPYP